MGTFRRAFAASFPVLMGYGALGLAFGLVLIDAGLPWWLATVMALFVYAGAAQFMGVGLIASGASLGEIALLTLLMNARHMVYGLSLLERFKGTGALKPYLVFALTDETYGLLTTTHAPEGEEARFYGLVSALDQAYWVIGCTAGAALGAALKIDARGMDFALTALFVVLLMEQALAARKAEPFIVAGAAAALALVLSPGRDFLVVAMLLALAALLVMGSLRARVGKEGT